MTVANDRAGDIAAAAAVLDRLGVSPQDLLTPPPSRAAVPTFGEYIPVVSAAVGEATRKAYTPYWNRILAQWPHRRLDEPTATDVTALSQHCRAHAVVRRNSRGGRSAAGHLITALRCVYTHAVADGLIDAADNPAVKAKKPRRLPSTRSALPADLLGEIGRVAETTGDDPALDCLILRLHTETACRRGGALALRPDDLDPTRCLIRLREKGGTVRWQPVSPTLMAALLRHAQDRGTPADGQLLRYRGGKPITKRRYDHLFTRLGRHLPWVATHGISIHWLRHTTLTWVERNFGYAIARRFAGHTDQRGEGATATYVRAGLEDVAAAVAALTGEPHPLAPASRPGPSDEPPDRDRARRDLLAARAAPAMPATADTTTTDQHATSTLRPEGRNHA